MSIHILVCGALDGLCCCTVLQVECIRSDSFSKKNLIVLSVGVGHPFGAKECHNSTVPWGRSPEKTITTRERARKSKQGRNCSVFNHHHTVTEGVFIAQRFTYSLAKIS